MKIIVAHNRYQQRGGEDIAFERECELLASRGHQIIKFEVANDSLSLPWKKIWAGMRVSYSFRSKRKLAEALRKHRPDLVHVHNFFPLLTPSIYDACDEVHVPVVQSLHNFRITCANGLLLREGMPCELCIGGSPYQGVRYACYRGSRLQSYPVARMIELHRASQTWQSKVKRFIAASEFARRKFVKAGLPERKIAVKPNFSPEPRLSRPARGFPYALYAGRLSEEKGIATLIHAWKGMPLDLKIAGSGPLEEGLRAKASPQIQFLGRLEREALEQVLAGAAFLVVPSECYENFPLILAEAFSLGVPVLSARIGGLPEIVEEGMQGLAFAVGQAEDLRSKALEMSSDPQRLKKWGEAARRKYEEKYSPEPNYQALMQIYAQTLRS